MRVRYVKHSMAVSLVGETTYMQQGPVRSFIPVYLGIFLLKHDWGSNYRTILLHIMYVFCRKNEIPFTNMLSFNSDNCSVMKGIRGGLIAKLRSVSPNVFDIGCCCHLANLAVAALLKQTPFSLDDLLVDICTYFRNRYHFIYICIATCIRLSLGKS